jgi:hypothetical protein
MGKDNRIEKLEKQIRILEAARQNTYVYETHHLHCINGELHIGYGDVDNLKRLVINVDQLYRDLPSIISMVCKEQKKMQEMHLEMIKEAQTEI